MPNLALNVVVSAVDHLTAPLKRVAQITESTGESMSRFQSQLASNKGQQSAIDRFRRLSNGTQGLGKRLKETQSRTAELAKAIDSAERPSRRLQQQFRASREQSKRLKESLGQQKTAVEKLRRELGDAGIQTSRLGSAQRELKQQAESLNNALEGQRKRLTMINKLKMAGHSAGSTAKQWGVRGLVGGTALGYAFNRTFVQTAAEFERYQTTLETVEGSKKKAKEAMNWNSNFAASTPFGLPEVNQTYVKLRSYGMDPKKNGLLKTLGDTASAMGKSLDQAAEAIADAVTAENERLKEFGITSSMKGNTITYNYTDKNGDQKTATANKNDRKQIQAVITGIWKSKYAGAMEKQSKTWSGMISNLSDQWTRFMNMVMSAGLFDWMKNKLGAFLDKVNGLAKSGKLKELAKTLSERLQSVFETLYNIGQALWGVASTVGNVVSVIANMVGGFRNLGIVVGTLVVGAIVAKLVAFGAALVRLSGQISMATAAARGGGGGGGFMGRLGRGGSVLGKVGRFAGVAGAALSVMSIGSTLLGSGSASDKAKAVTESVGSIGGSSLGTSIGAAIGSVILPGVGTVIGGALGSIAGGYLGDTVGRWLGSFFGGSDSSKSEIAKKVNEEAKQPALAANRNTINNNQQYKITVHQQPHEDIDAVYNRVMSGIDERNRVAQQGLLYDHG